MSLPALLIQTITVYRQNPVKDSSGGSTQRFALVPDMVSLPASIQPMSGSAMRKLAQRQVFVDTAIYVNASYDIRRGDKIVDPATNRSFLVHGYLDMAGRSVCWVIHCKEET